MIKKILYWLFESENKYMNNLCERQMKMLNEQEHVKEFFKILNTKTK